MDGSATAPSYKFHLGRVSKDGLEGLVAVADGAAVVDHQDSEAHLQEDLGADLEVGGAHLVRAAVDVDDQRNVSAREGDRLGEDGGEVFRVLPEEAGGRARPLTRDPRWRLGHKVQDFQEHLLRLEVGEVVL